MRSVHLSVMTRLHVGHAGAVEARRFAGANSARKIHLLFVSSLLFERGEKTKFCGKRADPPIISSRQ
jgi:hypothetical protein